MDIIISNSNTKPIYEQITAQIKNNIIAGKLHDGDALPSMRLLAKDLRISVITTKRAYEDLERDGFILNVAGKGCFIAPRNREIIREEQLRVIQEQLQKAIDTAKASNISLDEILSILDILYKGE